MSYSLRTIFVLLAAACLGSTTRSTPPWLDGERSKTSRDVRYLPQTSAAPVDDRRVMDEVEVLIATV